MFDVGCSMLDVRCWMFDVGCSMLDVRCWMFDVGRSMLDVRCSMFDVRCSMFDVRCSMFDVRCSMFDVRCSMFDVRCWMFDVRCSMFDVRCSMFDVRCSMFDVRCSMFDVRCSMFDVQCSVLIGKGVGGILVCVSHTSCRGWGQARIASGRQARRRHLNCRNLIHWRMAASPIHSPSICPVNPSGKGGGRASRFPITCLMLGNGPSPAVSWMT
jgi:hypothetical protein